MNNLNKEIGKSLTPPKKFFNWCENQIPTYEWSNKEKTILASSRKGCHIIKKKLTKNSRLSYPEKFYPFAIVLVSKNRIEIQSHCYWHEIKDGKEILTSEMVNFERFSNGQHLKASLWRDNWYSGLLSNYGYMSGAYTNTRFFANEWNERLKNNQDMKYLHLPKLSHFEIARVYKYRQEIEYLQSIKATNLANELMFKSEINVGRSWFNEVDLRVINKKWLRKNKTILKTENPTFNALMIIKVFKDKHIKYVKGIEKHVHYKQLLSLPKEYDFKKFQSYLINQDIQFNDYFDYIDMLKELKKPLDNHMVIYPKDFTKAHDNAVTTVYMLKNEVDEKAYKSQLSKAKKLEKEIDDFIFLVPSSFQEIVKEGNSLHHCVGSSPYLNKQVKGETNIIFIRKKESLSTPYITMEYENKRVTQIQGYKNKENIPNEVHQAINKWQKKVKYIS